MINLVKNEVYANSIKHKNYIQPNLFSEWYKNFIYPKTHAKSLRRLSHLAEFGKISQGLFHDLINPITAIVLFLETIPDRYKNNPCFEELTKSSERMEEFLLSIKKYSKATNKGEEGIEKYFIVEKEIMKAIEIQGYRARKAGVMILHKSSSRKSLFGDPIKFQQVFMNLISNAVDSYIDTNSISKKILIEMEVEKHKNKQFLKIGIKDFGCGMSPKLQKEIFKPFFTTKGSGSGIGLMTVQQVIEKDFNGKIEVKSAPQHGALFTIEIPID